MLVPGTTKEVLVEAKKESTKSKRTWILHPMRTHWKCIALFVSTHILTVDPMKAGFSVVLVKTGPMKNAYTGYRPGRLFAKIVSRMTLISVIN